MLQTPRNHALEMVAIGGILVALGIVVYPSLIEFVGKGGKGIQAEERQNVQLAMDTMMASNGAAKVTATPAGEPGVRDFESVPPEGPLFGTPRFLDANPTTYWYCWDSAGHVTQKTLGQKCP